MWLLFTLAHCFLLALVNYIDEYLTANNALPSATDLHTKIGGLLLVSTLFSVIGMFVVWLAAGNVEFSGVALWLSLLSALPMVLVWAGYFYLLNLYPVYQVIPLFQLASFWLLAAELLSGGSITFVALTGIVLLVVGAYLLDSGTVKWQVPTKLLFSMIGVSLAWAATLFLVRLVSEMGVSTLAITFWQFVGVVGIGIFLFVAVARYRDGFLFRVRHQGTNFLGFSAVNESMSQGAYFAGNMAVALAPLAVYFSALGGLQSVMLLIIFLLFPQKPVTVNNLQKFSVLMIALGIFLIEGWKYI